MQHVLIVDDDALHARSIARLVGRRCNTVIVESIQEAMRAYDGSERWAAAVVDVGLPDGSGLTLLEELRARWGAALPVLVLTGQDEKALVNRAQALRAQFAYKPCSRDNIEAFLDGALSRPRPTREQAKRDKDAVEAAIGDCIRIYQLSFREAELLRHAVDGAGRTALRERLDVTENTLKTMIRRTLLKCGAQDLDELVADVLRSAAAR